VQQALYGLHSLCSLYGNWEVAAILAYCRYCIASIQFANCTNVTDRQQTTDGRTTSPDSGTLYTKSWVKDVIQGFAQKAVKVYRAS